MHVDDALRFVLEQTGAAAVRAVERLTSLWGGYGELTRVRLEGGLAPTVVLKRVRPPPAPSDERSHARKVRSYEVEAAFYVRHARACDDGCRVPACLGATSLGRERLLLLEDLDAAGFGGRCRRSATRRELEACLGWLACFHARFVGASPEGLWSTGTYWHLATRPDELAATRDPRLREAAPALDARLEGARWKTLVHGDAKEANFCFGEGRVAAVDFQYVGGGVGVRDVAYLLTGGAHERAGLTEDAALELYFERLRGELGATLEPADVRAVEREWRLLYPVAWADFERFLAGWAPTHTPGERSRARLERVLATL